LSEAEELLSELSNAVVLGDVHKARKIAEQVVNRRARKKSKRKEYSVMDLVAAASAMQEAFEVFEPHLRIKPAGKVLELIAFFELCVYVLV